MAVRARGPVQITYGDVPLGTFANMTIRDVELPPHLGWLNALIQHMDTWSVTLDAEYERSNVVALTLDVQISDDHLRGVWPHDGIFTLISFDPPVMVEAGRLMVTNETTVTLVANTTDSFDAWTWFQHGQLPPSVK